MRATNIIYGVPSNPALTGSDILEREDVRCMRPLHMAAQALSPELVGVLLKHGADPNAVNDVSLSGDACMRFGTQAGKVALLCNSHTVRQPELVKVLLKHGTDPNAVNDVI